VLTDQYFKNVRLSLIILSVLAMAVGGQGQVFALVFSGAKNPHIIYSSHGKPLGPANPRTTILPSQANITNKKPQYGLHSLIIKFNTAPKPKDLQDFSSKHGLLSMEQLFANIPNPQTDLQNLQHQLAAVMINLVSLNQTANKVSKVYIQQKANLTNQQNTLNQQIKAQEDLIQRIQAQQQSSDINAPAVPDLSTIYKVTIPSNAKLDAVINDIRLDTRVVYAQLNYLYKLSWDPNDKFFNASNSWGQGYADQWGPKIIQADLAWNTARGAGQVVAVIDTGVDYMHPDLAANILKKTDGSIYGYNFSEGTNDPFDYMGHGTHCAGIIAAVADNHIGIAGVAPDARIMPIKVFPNAYDSVVSQAIKYAVDNGARVLSNSYGYDAPHPSDRVLEDMINYASSKNTVVVFAAGNNTDDVDLISPQNDPQVITVAASDQNDQRLWWSNYGDKIDVSAPGGGGPDDYNVLSLLSSCRPEDASTCFADDPTLAPYIVGGKYIRLGGTSMAAPHVAALAALVLSNHPKFSNRDVKQLIEYYADDVDTPSGRDVYMGYGRINANNTVLADQVPIFDSFDALEIHNKPNSYGHYSGTISFYGTAYGGDFASYTVEYSDPTQAQWTTISQSSTPIKKDGLMATLDTTTLRNGDYKIRLRVNGASGKVMSEQLRLIVDNNNHMSLQWRQNENMLLEQDEQSSVYFADLNNNGSKEIVNQVGDAISANKKLISQLKFPADWIAFYWDVAFGDINGDGNMDIVIPAINLISAQEGIFVFDKNGDLLKGWPYLLSLGRSIITVPTVANLDGGKGLESIFNDVYYNDHIGSYESDMIVLGPGGAIYSNSWPKLFKSYAFTDNPAVADLNGDGLTDIIAPLTPSDLSAHSNVHVWDKDGKELPGFPVAEPGADRISPIVAHLDNTPNYDIINATGCYFDLKTLNQVPGAINVWDNKGNLKPGFPQYFTPYETPGAPPAVADFHHDGNLETVVVNQIFSGLYAYPESEPFSQIIVHVYQNDGTEMTGFPVTISTDSYYAQPQGLLIADMDGSGDPEIIVPVLDDMVYVIKKDGSYANGWPSLSIPLNFANYENVSNRLQIAYLANQANAGLYMAIQNEKLDSGYNTTNYIDLYQSTKSTGQIYWGNSHHDLQRTGFKP